MTKSIIHQLLIYKKPRQAISGTRTVPVINDQLLATYEAHSYKHQIIWQGGDDTASCELDVNDSEAQDIFGKYLGNRVQVVVDNPMTPIWEGFINRISYEINGFKFSVSLDSLGNRVMLSYFNAVSAPNNKVTAEVTDASSIAVYGSKMLTKDIGVEYLTTDNRHTITRNKYLAQQADPYKQMTVSPTGKASAYNLKLEMRGFYHTLGWDTFEVGAVAGNPGGVVLNYIWYAGFAVATGYNSSRFTGNGTGVFFNTEDYLSTWTTNTSYATSTEKRAGQSHLDFIRQHVEAGDGTNDWVFGIGRTNPNLGYRRAYYRQANTDVKYYTNLYGDRRIYTSTGELIDPWTVTPDASISILDMPVFSNPLGGGVPTPYITKVNYDGESQQVTWQSKEDLTLTGQYQIGQVNRAEGSPFGQLARRNYY